MFKSIFSVILTIFFLGGFTFEENFAQGKINYQQVSSICDGDELCEINARLKYLWQFRNGEGSCGVKQKVLACKISPWRGKSLNSRIKLSLYFLKEVVKQRSFSFDARAFVCLQARESPLFEPAVTNYNACDRKKGVYSTANGLSGMTKRTAKRLFDKDNNPFRSSIAEYQNIEDGEELFSQLSMDIRLQMELSLFYLDILFVEADLSYEKALRKYHSWPNIDLENDSEAEIQLAKAIRRKSKHYAGKIGNCFSCIENVLDEDGVLREGQTMENLVNCLDKTNPKQDLQANFLYYEETLCQQKL